MTFAQSGGGFDLSWSTIDSGGAMSSAGGGFEVAGTIGQPDTQSPPVLFGGTFELIGGFWPVANVCLCLGDMNVDGLQDGADIQRFVNCVIEGGDCSCADVDEVNGVTLADVNVFVSALLSSLDCP